MSDQLTVNEVSGSLADLNKKLGSVNGREWHVALNRFLRKENPWEVVEKAAATVIQKTTDLLKLVKEALLPATGEKKVKECFVGSRYYHRDSDLDGWLAKVQPAGVEGKLSVWQLEKELTFKEVAQAILGVDDASLDDLAKGLIAGGHTVVLSQIEALIERTDTGEDLGLRTDGWGNFFFVEDKDGGVSVVHVYRHDVGRWLVGVRRLDDGGRWRVEFRFFSRN